MKGETIAIGVAVLWTLSALFFEYASKRLGSVNLNLIRLVCAFFMLGITMTLINGSFIPVGADKATWFWMSLSGLVGFVLGDYFLFASYSIIMARFSQLIMTLAPPFAAIFGFILLGEKMSWIAGGRRCIERWGSDLVFYLMNRGDAVKIINKIQ